MGIACTVDDPTLAPQYCVCAHCGFLLVVCVCDVREFEQLREGVVSLWEQLEAPPDEIVSFLSECDLIAPYNPRVLDLCVSPTLNHIASHLSRGRSRPSRSFHVVTPCHHPER